MNTITTKKTKCCSLCGNAGHTKSNKKFHPSTQNHETTETTDNKYNVGDIELFFKTGTRGQNDAHNKIREAILCFLADPLNEEYSIHEKWNILYNCFHAALTAICKTNYSKVEIKTMAGRQHNYDFAAIFYDSEHIEICRAKLEFKHNSKSLLKIPQILSLIDRHGLITELSYSSYYYTNYLDAHLLAIGYAGAKPLLEEYVSLVSGIDYDKHPMFAFMKTAESAATKTIAKESIQKYLEIYWNKLNVVSLTTKLIESQRGKFFLLWDISNPNNAKFNIETLSDADLTITTVDRVKNKNAIVVASANYEFHLLLRWRNHAGIMNPAWQISLVKRPPNI